MYQKNKVYKNYKEHYVLKERITRLYEQDADSLLFVAFG